MAPERPADRPPETDSFLANDGRPIAGFHGGNFFVRDRRDLFRLYVQGRAQIDVYTFFGPGVGDTALKPTVVLRRLRPELSGEFLKRWQWMIAGDWGNTSIDNPRGTNQTSAAAPGADPSASSARYASAQTAGIRAAPTDVYINFKAVDRLLNLQFGQFDAPFTMENRTTDKFFAFMERPIAVRDLGVPTNKEIGLMAWGAYKDYVHYALGGFLGEGQGRLNVDSRFELMSRVYSRPLSSMKHDLKDLQIGASFRYGSRDPALVNYDYPLMTTQGGYAFWSPIYTGANGVTHIIPANNQIGVAAELRVPFRQFDLTSELVYVDNMTREAIEGYQSTNSERFGRLTGVGYYVQLGWWPLGNRDINGVPGTVGPTHVNLEKPDTDPKQALQVLAMLEQIAAKYESASGTGTPDPTNTDGDIDVLVFKVGANYWFTKHVRLTANYVFNHFPDSAPVTPTGAGSPQQTAEQRALAPGNTIAAGIDDEARDNAHTLHELLFRVAVAF